MTQWSYIVSQAFRRTRCIPTLLHLLVWPLVALFFVLCCVRSWPTELVAFIARIARIPGTLYKNLADQSWAQLNAKLNAR